MILSVVEIRLTLILHVVNYDSFREHETNSTYMIHLHNMILSFSLVHSSNMMLHLIWFISSLWYNLRAWFSRQLCYIICSIGSFLKKDSISCTWFTLVVCYSIIVFGSFNCCVTITLCDSFVHLDTEISIMIHVSNIWLFKF